MADTFDPYDENDVFDAASLNDRFGSLKDRINELPINSSGFSALGPNHIGSLLSNTRTQTKVLTPRNAVLGEPSGSAWYCDPIRNGYPGYLVEDFENALPQGRCWQRLADSTGGSGAGTQYAEVNLSGMTVGDTFNSLLIMANIEVVAQQFQQTNDFFNSTYFSYGGGGALATIISTVSSTGTRTFHWESLRLTSAPQGGATLGGLHSVDVPHRLLINKPDFDVSTVQVLVACLDDITASQSDVPNLSRCLVRFCQLTAVALYSKVN